MPAAVAQKPNVVLAFEANAAFQESGVAVSVLPDTVVVALQELLNVDWFRLTTAVQLVVPALPEFVTVTFAQYPCPQSDCSERVPATPVAPSACSVSSLESCPVPHPTATVPAAQRIVASGTRVLRTYGIFIAIHYQKQTSENAHCSVEIAPMTDPNPVKADGRSSTEHHCSGKAFFRPFGELPSEHVHIARMNVPLSSAVGCARPRSPHAPLTPKACAESRPA